MKKFCNKLSKQQWRMSVPNLNTSIFRRSLSVSQDENSGSYNVENAVESSENSGSYLTIDSESETVKNSVISETDSDIEYEDAIHNLEISEGEEQLYADIENSLGLSPSPEFVYDIPKISFSFFEGFEGEAIDAKPKHKSEIKIVLASPPRIPEEIEETDEPPRTAKTDTIDNTQSLDDISIAESKYEISSERKLEFELSRLSLDDLCLTNLMKSDSLPSLTLRENNQEDFYKVPTKPYKRLSRSLYDINQSKSDENENEKTIIHNVVLDKKTSLGQINDPEVKLDYCNTRSKLPIKVRRATLLRRPQMRLKTPESWQNLRSKVSTMISSHSAAQRVGASQNQSINLDEFYEKSRSKCKKLVKRFRKRGQENLDPNVETCSETSSQIVKNDAFFAKVECGGDNESGDTLVGADGDRFLSDERSVATLKSAFRRSRVMITEGQNGFEDLRRFVKQGGDFCKELSTILQERSEAELQYAKSLSKLSSKLNRACRDGAGGLNDAWKSVAQDMETRAEAHRQFSSAMTDDIVKPLKQLTESQHKQRKVAENAVDKTGRGLGDWRAAEAKSKKQSHQCARDNEKLQDALLDVRLSRSTSLIQLAHMHNHKTLSDKESAKLEGKKRKAEDAVKKADIEYYTLCVRAERARLEWESAVLRGSKTFQALEEERLHNLKTILNSYLKHNSEMCPKLSESTEKIRKPITESDPAKDMSAFVNLRNTSQHVSEQLLPDFYCEHITLAMNRERRKQALIKLLHLIRQDLERERKSKNGLENLSRAIKQTPNFGAEDSQQNVTEKLYHMRSMLTYLEGARYKVQSALAEMENRQRTSHPLATHINVTRDKSGLQQSILKVPPWLRDEFTDHEKVPQVETGETELPDWTDRGMGDGNSNQHDSDFDEFSSQESGSLAEECHNVPLGQCKALYAYTANLPDELNLHPGDVLSVYRKQEDGWWLGECNGCVGIFPATYVENIS